MEELIKWIQGYLTIQVEGNCFEKLLKICKAHNMFLWKIEQKEKGFCVCIYQRDFLQFAGLCRKVKLHLHVLQKKGLPFILRKLYRKLYFLVFLVMAVGMLKSTQLHVWAIEIQGNQMITKDEIMDFMSEEHIFYGMHKREIDCEGLELKMREHFPLITWVSVYLNGTKLHVDMKENALGSIKQKEIPQDILSPKDGMVISVLVEQGEAKVKAGDEVTAGDVLISCQIPVYDEGQNVISYQQTTPEATIRMQTTQKYQDFLENTYLATQFADEKKTYYYIEFGKKRYYLNKFWEEKGSCETLCCTRQLSLQEQLYLPLFYGCENVRKVDFQYFAYTDKEMEKVLSERLEKYILCLREKGVQIMKKNVKISKNGSAMYMSGELELIEDMKW